jgi:tetratricopeptide (TPR) repeat protein
MMTRANLRWRVWLLAGLVAFSAGLTSAADVADLMKQAQVLDRKLQAAEALELYTEVEKLDPNNAEVLTAIARQYRHLMQDANSKAEKQRLCEMALVYGEKAAAADPKDSDAQLSVAITCGKMLKLKSAREQVGVSRRIKESVDKALKLDPGNDLAWYVLGRWHQGYADLSSMRRAMGEIIFGKLPDSSHEDAARCFEKAMQANPRRLMHVVELGVTYGKLGRAEEARRLIEKGLAMPNVEKDDPEVKERGREALKSLRDSTPKVAEGESLKPVSVENE